MVDSLQSTHHRNSIAVGLKWFFLFLANALVVQGRDSITISEIEGPLRIEISGIEVMEGSIVVAIWDDRERWLKEAPIWGEALPAVSKGLVFYLQNLEPGRYALSVFHDLNDNQDIDANFLGIPIEPIGFSNNVRNRFGPARFEQAAFEVGEEMVEQHIELWRAQQSQSRRNSQENEEDQPSPENVGE